jgi:hypothetical protein
MMGDVPILPAPLYSLWLLPERAWAENLAKTMGELALLFRIPAFPPHVTIQGDLALPLDEVRRGMEALVEGGGSLVLDVSAVDESPDFFRSLYLRFSASEGFSRLQELSFSRFGTREGLAPFPHLSLSYGDALGRAEKKALASRLSPLFRERRMAFSSIALALSASTLPIEGWKILGERRL